MSNSQVNNIVLVCSDCDNTRILYHGIKDDINISHIIIEQTVSKKLLIKRRIKKLGIFTVVSQLIFQAGVVPLMRKLSASRVSQILDEKKLDISPMPENKIIRVPSVNDHSFTEAIRSINPSLLLVNGTRIISGNVLQQISSPVINVHVGITPLYRGVHGAYWALASNDAAHCGVTVHAVDKGIDTGGILAQDIIEPTKKDNFVTYPYLQFHKAIALVKKTVPLVLNKSAALLPAPGPSRLWSHPTIWQYIANRFKGIR